MPNEPTIIDTLARSGWRARALDWLLPPLCMACRQPVSETGGVCGACWAGIDFIAPPWCAVCGLPFPFALGDGAVCGGCAATAPRFRRARAVMRYRNAAAALVTGFKFGDRTNLAPSLAAWLQRSGAEVLAEAELIAPVPLHALRLWQRRYNQAAMLSRLLAARTGIAHRPDLLRRTRRTRPQTGLTRPRRLNNVRGAFAVSPRHRDTVAGRRVLLVDDVMTTGATISECAAVLTRAGAAAVDVLTLARVVHTD